MTDETKPVAGYWTSLFKRYWGWLAVPTLILSQLGYLSPEQWQKITSKVESAAVKADTKPTVLPVVGDDTPRPQLDEDALVDKIIKRLQPVVEPPKPEPVPEVVTVDTRPKIVITDEAGATVEGGNVEAGKLLMVTASEKVPVGWSVSQHGNVRVIVMPENLGYAISLQKDSFVEFFLTDSSLKSVSMRVTCNLAPQPPPDVVPVPPTPPKPVPPQPDVEPTPPVEKTRVSLAVVHVATDISPETAIVLNSLDTWNEFTAKGNEWIIYDTADSSPEGIKAEADAGDTKLPSLVVYDKETGTKLASVPLPKTRKLLQELVSSFTGDTYSQGTGNGR